MYQRRRGKGRHRRAPQLLQARIQIPRLPSHYVSLTIHWRLFPPSPTEPTHGPASTPKCSITNRLRAPSQNSKTLRIGGPRTCKMEGTLSKNLSISEWILPEIRTRPNERPVSAMLPASRVQSSMKRWACPKDECDKHFQDRSALRKHLLYHVRPYSCPACKMGFSVKKDLRRHQQTRDHGGQDTKELLSCHEHGCGFRTYRRDNLKRHCRLRHEPRPGRDTSMSGSKNVSGAKGGDETIPYVVAVH
ncbi:hypothetical protein B0H67DRAFT_392296 [Lasiosphaeris hirsuta]|uniref:C2H2-type domain-containing protein n=1 Tax=Lasiosphaeris hirsuta TaxID=260670 RepID=A0AA39ZSD6_9PEZI|nr:hypothetical protein B0H67DRAFT_392296 [Lasiosphaeris hirsuta]